LPCRKLAKQKKVNNMAKKPGLYANIHAKRDRIAAGQAKKKK